MKILYAASECYPFIKTGGLGDVAGSLPKALAKAGAEVSVVLPLYEEIGESFRREMTFLMYTYVFLSWRRQYCGLFKLEKSGVTYYFVDNEYYFKRIGAYGHYDDGERFGFFSRAIVQMLPLIGLCPDIIHCNDWQTALVPIYLREEQSDFYRNIKTVFTIHNIEYQGRYGRDTLHDLFGLPISLLDSGIMHYDGDVNLMKGAIYASDYITTVSPTYAHELKIPYYAHGLHQVIEENSHKLQGILNGIDMDVYDPMTDCSLYHNYCAENPETRVYNKLELQRLLGLRADESIPVIACVSRLAAHKGFDLILEVLPRIMDENVQLVVLGTGEWDYEQSLIDAQSRYQGRVSANIMYSAALASEIYAGSDIFLMPSRSEPCGLSQMIAMRYGALPLVRETGGLKDTVFPYPAENSNGFVFANYSAEDMLHVLCEAIGLYADDKDAWQALMKRGMETDFGWGKSACEYIELYEKIIQ